MGTTVSGIVRVGDHVAIAHIGDSAHLPLPRRRARADHDRPHLRAASGRQRAASRRRRRPIHPRRAVLDARAGGRRRLARARQRRAAHASPATAGCCAPTVSAATSPRTRSPRSWAVLRTALDAAELAREGEPRPGRPRQRHGAASSTSTRPASPAHVPPVFVGSAAHPLVFEPDGTRAPAVRLPSLLLHPLKASQPDASALRARRARSYLDELIEEDRRRVRRRRISWLVVRRRRDRRPCVAARASATSGPSSTTTWARSEGRVAIFQGVQQDIGPISLSSRGTDHHDPARRAARLPARAGARPPSTPTDLQDARAHRRPASKDATDG